MDTLRVALLNASYRDAAAQANFSCDADAAIQSFAVNQSELPPDYGYDAVIGSGSGALVCQDGS